MELARQIGVRHRVIERWEADTHAPKHVDIVTRLNTLRAEAGVAPLPNSVKRGKR